MQPVFPEADPYPSLREPGVQMMLRAPVMSVEKPKRAKTFGDNTSVAIQKYVDEAIASTRTRRPTPLPRSRAPRGSEAPQPNGQFAGMPALRPPETGLAGTMPGNGVWSIPDEDDVPDLFSAEEADTDEAFAPPDV